VVSLLTQREAIADFAARKHLLVTGWYEEKVTAAKRGGPVDLSAPHLKDGADLGELVDSGIPVTLRVKA
jgi:hypothetical protein